MQFLQRLLNPFHYYWAGLFLALSFNLSADIVTDGTVGSAQTLSGPNFSIPENLGSRSGDNLFHSFQTFNINHGEQATFSGSANIRNVISRVTGGQISNIYGLLQSTIGQADFYFLNPAGVVFGANAQIDVPASFYLSTADELRFADGFVYSASNPTASSLTISQPEAFGFLGDQTANITIQQSSLGLSTGKTFSVSSSEIQIDSAQIQIDAGNVQLAAVGTNATEVTVLGDVPDLAQGQLRINGSLIDVAGDGAGIILVRSGASEINLSRLFADNIGSAHPAIGQGINISADSLQVSESIIAADTFGLGQQAPDVIVTTTGHLSIVNGAFISSSTFAEGNAGNIFIKAGQLTIDSQGNDRITTITSESSASGDTANITVDVKGKISLVNAGFISTTPFGGSGNAGNIKINAGQLLIDGQGSQYGTGIFSDSETDSLGQAGVVEVNVKGNISIVNGGFIRSSSFASSDAGEIIINSNSLTIDSKGNTHALTGIGSSSSGFAGNAGVINIGVNKTLSIFGDSSIVTNTRGTGDAGNIIVKARDLILNGKDALFSADIGSSALRGSQGNAGEVIVHVKDTLTIEDGGIIHSATNGAGHAGSVNINAGSLKIDGIGSKDRAGIFNTSEIPNSSGNAGNVTVNVRNTLSLINGGRINTGTSSKGKAGTIIVETDQLIIDGRGTNESTGIISSATKSSSGQAGSIMLKANNIYLTDGGISTASLPTVDLATLAKIQPAKIAINAQNLTLTDSFITSRSTGNIPAGSIILNVTDILSIDPSSISTTANNANGGVISIQADIINLQDSQITTSVTGQGNGGDISLNSNVLVLDSGFIQANTTGTNVIGGDIQINTPSLITSQNIIQTGGNTPLSVQPGLNVIQAAAPDGVSGNIKITSPQLNISGDLTDLDSALLDVDQLAKNPCTTAGGRQSRLASLGHGGLPETPDQAGSVVINSERLEQLLPMENPANQPSIPNVLLEPMAQNEREC